MTHLPVHVVELGGENSPRGMGHVAKWVCMLANDRGRKQDDKYLHKVAKGTHEGGTAK